MKIQTWLSNIELRVYCGCQDSHLSTCPSNPLGMDQRLLVHRETFSSFGRPGSQRFEAGGFPWEFAGEEIGGFAYFCMLL